MSGTGIDRTEAYRQLGGVDLDLSNEASAIASQWAQTTWGNRDGGYGTPIASDNHFSSARRLSNDEIRRRPGVDSNSEMDGSGTKPEFYERMGNFWGLGRDIIAMGADDMPIHGGETCYVDNMLVVNKLAPEYMTYIDQLFQGLAEAANEARLVLYTGEIATHGDRLRGPTDFTIDWSACAKGLLHVDREITGENVKPGDELWAFGEPESLRCNGTSLVREAFRAAYGPEWHTERFKGSTLGQMAVVPSTIYSGLMTDLTGGYKLEVKPKADIHGAAHISGGSIPEKLGRMLLATGHGAELDDPFELPAIMRHAQQVARIKKPDGTTRRMTDEEMITAWHGGQGYIVAIDGRDAEAVHSTADALNIKAKRIGYVTKKPGIKILSRGALSYGDWMRF